MNKKLCLLMLSLISFQGWAADNVSICNEIKAKVSTGTPHFMICGDVGRNYEKYDVQIFMGICNDMIMRYQTDMSDQNDDFCKEQFKPLTTTEAAEGDELVKIPVDSTPPIPTEEMTTSSVVMERCQEDDLSSFACTTKSTIVLPDINTILSAVSSISPQGVSRKTPAVYTKVKCDCFEQSVNKTFTSNEKKVQFDLEIAAERQRINEVIFNAAGKKIINAFAANLEDINFYKTNNVEAIGGNRYADEFQCTDAEEYKKVITADCNRNRISAGVIKGRTDALLGAFGDFKGQSTIEGKFKELQDEVLNARLDPSKIQEGGPSSYSRRDYDEVRNGISQKRDEVKFMSELTDAVMDDALLKAIIVQDIESGKRPGHALMRLVSDESNPKVKDLLNRIARKHKKAGFYNNLSVALRTANQQDLKSLMLNTYDLATDMHPGLKAIFRSPELFHKTHSQMEVRGQHDLIAELDRDPELLKTFFKKRCEGLIAQFSEAICVKSSDFTDMASKEDLNKLLSSVSGQISPVLKDAILCRMPDNKDSNSIFAKLSFNMGDKLMMADYFKRKVNTNEGPASRFDKFAIEFSSGGNITRYMEQMAEYKSELRKPSAEYVAIDQAAASKLTDKFVPTTASQIQEKVEPQIAPAFSNNYAASSPVLPEKDQTHHSKDQRDSRSMLRDFLADEESREEVDRHFSNISPKDQLELERLRAEIASDREKILALTQESERLRLRGYQEQVKIAEAAIKEPQTNNRSSERKDVIDQEEETVGSVSPGPSSAQTAGARETSSASSTPSAGSSNGRGSAGTQRSLASLNSALPNSVSGNNTSLTMTTNERGEIVIQSSGSEDVSKEVISFVQKNEPDVNTLKKLKTSGMTFKYKVIENGVTVEKEIKVNYASLSKEAKQFLDQKIAVKEARRNYSYNALRLMLGLKAQKQL